MTDRRPPRPELGRRLGPQELRALAHPLRLRLLEELMILSEATASQLGARVDESAANCSWHLRQLAKYGFIEPGERRGRERPWRWVRESLAVSADADESTEDRIARQAAVAVILDREIEAFRAWQVARSDAPDAWLGASFDSSAVNWLTPDELADLNGEVNAVVERLVLAHLNRIEPAHRPADARLVRFVAWAFPTGTVAELTDDQEPESDKGSGA